MTTAQKAVPSARSAPAASRGSVENKFTKLAITVLSGGPSAEREVSLQSGAAVHAALRRLGHDAMLRDISPADLSALNEPTDFVFIALHGEFGEDGQIQRELDARGLPYSGSGESASQAAMNKAESKRIIERADLPTPAWRLATRGNAAEIAQFPIPAVVKPVNSGSSVDLTIAKTPAALAAAVLKLVDRDGEALVEKYVRGRELTVGILGDRALPVCEIRTKREFYDYQAKYIDDDTQYLFDIDLPPTLLAAVQEMSVRAHNAIGCRVLSRVDWMIDGATLRPYFLEINTIPGFTSHSLVPKAAARIGLNFDQLCQKVIELSLGGG